VQRRTAPAPSSAPPEAMLPGGARPVPPSDGGGRAARTTSPPASGEVRRGADSPVDAQTPTPVPPRADGASTAATMPDSAPPRPPADRFGHERPTAPPSPPEGRQRVAAPIEAQTHAQAAARDPQGRGAAAQASGPSPTRAPTRADGTTTAATLPEAAQSQPPADRLGRERPTTPPPPTEGQRGVVSPVEVQTHARAGGAAARASGPTPTRVSTRADGTTTAATPPQAAQSQPPAVRLGRERPTAPPPPSGGQQRVAPPVEEQTRWRASAGGSPAGGTPRPAETAAAATDVPIHVRIGRIDARPPAATRANRIGPAAPRGPNLTLQQYLDRRRGPGR
jgi:hypothetical protein